MPPEGGAIAGPPSEIFNKDGISAISGPKSTKRNFGIDVDQAEVLIDDQGRPYNLGPKGFVCDLNTRAVKIARRVRAQALAVAAAEGNSGKQDCKNNNDEPSAAETDVGDSTLGPGGGNAVVGASGTIRTMIAQEIQFVLGGRLPFVKRSELLVWSWCALSAYFIVRYGLLEAGFAPTLAAFCVMYIVLDFYSGVLHVVLDDEWNMKVPLLSQPAMEFQYHHHIPDDGCSRPFVEGMGDLNFIIGLHLALFTALFIHGDQKNPLLLCAGAWKMLIAYWGIWNHRQAHQLKSKRPRWVTCLQNNGMMLSPAAHKVHHTPPHDDEYCLLGVTTAAVTWLERRKIGSISWILLFLVLTAVDTVCATGLLNLIFR